jgi:hypothetical protein
MLCFLIGTLEERLAVKNAAKASLRERAVEEYEIIIVMCNESSKGLEMLISVTD